MAEAAPDPNAGGDGTVKGGSAAMAEVRFPARHDLVRTRRHRATPARVPFPKSARLPARAGRKKHQRTRGEKPRLSTHPAPVRPPPQARPDADRDSATIPPPVTQADIPPELSDGQDPRHRLLRQGEGGGAHPDGAQSRDKDLKPEEDQSHRHGGKGPAGD